MIFISDKICSVCQSNHRVSRINGILYCGKHYLQIYRHGVILERTRYTPNNFEVVGDIIAISLYDKNQKIVGFTIVSIKYLDLVKGYKWSHTKEGYAMSYKNNKFIYLHRLIINAQKGEYVDHINHNTLDNTINNLRICTNAQNLQNHAKLSSVNTSGYIGVYWIKDKNKWRSEIQHNENKVHLGYFINLKDAIMARINAEKEYFGEFQSDINENNLKIGMV